MVQKVLISQMRVFWSGAVAPAELQRIVHVLALGV